MKQNQVTIAVKERMEELAIEKGTTLRTVLQEMRTNPRPSELSDPSRPSLDIYIVYHYCARLGISLNEFFEDERFH